ncbi:magnesium transporter CorA family protein [Actinoplanes sp. NPDC051851]|uniref:magnesium transporter CorA family protein n=1 Tax=Actinoplanes sp. NPDC051851 TaxID=3154753 RepID=UPI003417B9DC
MRTRLYGEGRVIAEDFAAGELGERLREHPDAVAWLDMLSPSAEDLQLIADEFGLHPLAVEDALEAHERPKLDRYPGHLFLNVYAVSFSTTQTGAETHKVEISAFVTPRVLITVHKGPGDVDRLVERWDSDTALAAVGGVSYLVHGLLDVVVDSQYATARAADEAMDGVEDQLLAEGGAPRRVRRYGYQVRRALAVLRRAVAPMADVVGELDRAGGDLVDDRMRPYFRDVEDHAKRTVESIDHAHVRITELLDADLSEQSNVLNDITRKLAAWAAVIAVPTALTGYFGQNLPYPGYQQFWGFVQSSLLIVFAAGALYLYLKRRGWL